jgi:RHS repeat-associated protein
MISGGSMTGFRCGFAAAGGHGFAVNTRWTLGPGGEQIGEFAVSGASSTGTQSAGGPAVGTKRVEVNAALSCETGFRSLPYGNGLTSYAPTALPQCVDATEQHYTGKERDTESGNDYFEARYYASSFGRFMSPDWSAKVAPVPYAKLDDPQTLNLFGYVRDNPVTGFDSDGHDCAGNKTCEQNDKWNNTHGIIPNGTLRQLDQVAMKAEKTALGKTRADMKNGYTKADGKKGYMREWGGLILQNSDTGAFSATSPITSNREREVDVDKVTVPDGFTVVGEYHTHPHNTLTEGIGPSIGDVNRLIGFANQKPGVFRVGYVGETAGGYVSRYTAFEYKDHSSEPYGVVIGVVPPQ